MILLSDALAGFLLGMCYDFFKAIRHKSNKPALDMLFDLCFWTLSLGVCVWLFLLTGDQKFRFYELFGTSTGFLCYFLVLSEKFVKIYEKIADFFLFFFKIPFTIFKFFAIIIKNGVLFLWMPVNRLSRYGKRYVFRCISRLKQHWKLMKRI